MHVGVAPAHPIQTRRSHAEHFPTTNEWLQSLHAGTQCSWPTALGQAERPMGPSCCPRRSGLEGFPRGMPISTARACRPGSTLITASVLAHALLLLLLLLVHAAGCWVYCCVILGLSAWLFLFTCCWVLGVLLCHSGVIGLAVLVHNVNTTLTY
jgi:hypothetical protein